MGRSFRSTDHKARQVQGNGMPKRWHVATKDDMIGVRCCCLLKMDHVDPSGDASASYIQWVHSWAFGGRIQGLFPPMHMRPLPGFVASSARALSTFPFSYLNYRGVLQPMIQLSR